MKLRARQKKHKIPKSGFYALSCLVIRADKVGEEVGRLQGYLEALVGVREGEEDIDMKKGIPIQ